MSVAKDHTKLIRAIMTKLGIMDIRMTFGECRVRIGLLKEIFD